jgi:glycosyltransferase involved in cell wall biosynthesis
MARILIIAYTRYIHDGRVKRHAEALAARGDRVDVITLRSGHEGLQNGVNVIGLPIERYRGTNRTRYLSSYLRFFIGASRLAHQRGRGDPYEVVITCTLPDAAVLSALPARLRGSRVILDMHDTMPELYEDKFGGWHGAMGAKLLMLVERACAGLADKVFAVHDLHRLRLEQSGIPSRKITVVINSPQPRIFEAAPKRIAPSDRCVLVCHGTITRRLGIDCAIRAVSLLVDRIPGVHLRVIGGGDYQAEARMLAARLNVSDRVQFAGSAPIEDVPHMLQDAIIGLVPNRASSATHLMLPVKLLEYAALGIPVIASRLRTVQHYFPDRDLSWACQEHRFFEAIDDLLDKPRTPEAAAQAQPEIARTQPGSRAVNFK